MDIKKQLLQKQYNEACAKLGEKFFYSEVLKQELQLGCQELADLRNRAAEMDKQAADNASPMPTEQPITQSSQSVAEPQPQQPGTNSASLPI
jgi:hypothetical protein